MAMDPVPAELVISLTRQTLQVVRAGRVEREFLVSTSRHGPGERRGSMCTPRGRHVIRVKIGQGLPAGAVLRGRRPTGEVFSPALDQAEPGRDWILSRILWLSGLEPGRNRRGDVDTMRRYIYIHGCPDELMQGQPASHGCIRMFNVDVLELYERIEAGIKVYIHED